VPLQDFQEPLNAQTSSPLHQEDLPSTSLVVGNGKITTLGVIENNITTDTTIPQTPIDMMAKMDRKNVAKESFICTWPDCQHLPFARPSDYKKHWDKHTKPYSCTESSCEGLNFGDKAGLQRHEKERHGKHGATRYFCNVETCPRRLRGFPRKKNRDVHVRTCHNVSSDAGAMVSGEGDVEEASPSPSIQRDFMEDNVATGDEEQVALEEVKDKLAQERSKVNKLEAKVKRLESLLAIYIK